MIESADQGLILSVYVQPGASKNQIIGPHNGALKIKIKSPPVDGKANEALLDYLKELTGLAKKNINLVSGEKSRQKKVWIGGLSEADLKNKLGLS